MRRRLGPVPALVAMIGLLLPAGVVAATTVAPGAAGRDQQVRTAGFLQEGVVAGPLASQPPEPPPAVTTTTTASLSPTTTTRNTASTVVTLPRAPTTTSVRPPETTRPTWTVPPGAPPIPTSTIPGGSSWSKRADGVSVRMHIEPAAPIAGQPVTFIVDYLITQDPCCAVGLMFGDSPEFSNVTGGTCESPTSLSDLSMKHTYAAPGAYEVVLATATFPCRPPGGGPVNPQIHGVGLHVCVVVGPGPAGAAGCPAGG